MIYLGAHTLLLLSLALAPTLGQRSDVRAVSKISSEDSSRLRRAAEAAIDSLFSKKSRRLFFEQQFRTIGISVGEKETLKRLGYDPVKEAGCLAYPDMRIRAQAVGWEYGYQPVMLVLSTMRLEEGKQFKTALDKAAAAIDADRKRILSKRGLTEEQFYSLLDLASSADHSSCERNLTALEEIGSDIEHFIGSQSNRATLRRNIDKMKHTITIEEVPTPGVYEIRFSPMFKMVLSDQNGKFMVLAFTDTI